MAAAIIIIPTPWCAAAIASSLSTSMCPAARRPRRRSSTASCSCSGKSAARETSSDDRRALKMTVSLQELADHVKASGLTLESGMAFGELTLTMNVADVVRVLTFLRDDPECEFKVLIDICGVDYPNRPKRFDVVY